MNQALYNQNSTYGHLYGHHLWSPPQPGVDLGEGCRGTHPPLETKVFNKIIIFFPIKAAEFHRQWKTPPTTPEERKKYVDVRRGDSTRGLERIGRYSS